MAYSKSLADLKQDLLEQIEFLKDSCSSYDKGKLSEAKRIALAMRILLHDKGRNTHSLLSQLGIKEKLQYRSFLAPLPHQESLITYNALTFAFNPAAGPPKIEANTSLPLRVKLTFADWWNALQLKSHNVSLTRSDIILSVADTDGGAHIDPQLKGGYANLVKDNGIGFVLTPNGLGVTPIIGDPSQQTGQPIEGKHELAFVRQIAHELLSTFDEQLPALLSAID